MSSALCLAGYGLAVGLVTPPWLRRTAAGGRAPRLGVAAWLLAVATSLLSLLAGMVALVRSDTPWQADLGWLLLVAGLTRAGWAGAVTWREVHARVSAHGEMVAILGRPDPGLGAVIVEAPEPLIYCLTKPSPTVVVTTGARQALSPIQLRAALAHERAHLAGRHHLLLAVMRTAARALPWLALFTEAEPAVAGLLEMRADDAAARLFGRRTVAAAIAAMGRGPAPVGALGIAGVSALARGLRLCATEPAWRVSAERLALAVTVLALAAGPYLSAALPFCPHNWW
jgi:Zn-dependent protease with chaperone function